MRQVGSAFQTLTHLNVSRQGGPNHGPGGDSNDQKPPDHPHDALGYQKRQFGWHEAPNSLSVLIRFLRELCGCFSAFCAVKGF
jgi:hypothetical protein